MENKNTWGLVFNKIDTDKDEIVQLLGLNLGSEGNARGQFDKIKNEFPSQSKDCVVDLVDGDDDIIDDLSLSLEQVKEVISLMGHDIRELE